MNSKITNNSTFCKAGGIVSTISIMIGIIIIGAITADNYSISQKAEKRSIHTQEYVNETVAQILATQENANRRGNVTIEYFTEVFKAMLASENKIQGNLTDHRIVANGTRDLLERSINQSLINQEQYFKPYLNQTFSKIFKALNITE